MSSDAFQRPPPRSSPGPRRPRRHTASRGARPRPSTSSAVHGQGRLDRDRPAVVGHERPRAGPTGSPQATDATCDWTNATSTVKLPVVALPVASVAVQSTVVGATAKDVPLSGRHVTTGDGSATSAAPGSVVGHDVAPGVVRRDRDVRSGVQRGCRRSTTVTTKLSLVVRLPLSVTEQVTVFAPSGTRSPTAGCNSGRDRLVLDVRGAHGVGSGPTTGSCRPRPSCPPGR